MSIDTRFEQPDTSSDTLDPGAVGPPAPSRLRRWAMSAIVLYQRAVEGRPSPCRFTPSCSAYALESFEHHSTGKAVRLTLRRFTKCRPFGPSGYDPVPEPQHTDQHSHEDC